MKITPSVTPSALPVEVVGGVAKKDTSASAEPTSQRGQPPLPSADLTNLPGQVATGGPAAVLVGRVGVGDVSGERFTLEDAVLEPTFAARDPATIPVPAELLAALETAERVLLIGHVGPDGDCVGSTLAMARALDGLGKARVDVCIDGELNGFLRQIDDRSRVQQPAALAGQSWDLALVLDAAGQERIGGAADLLLEATTVAVADHHVVDPHREDFPLREGAEFLRWVEPDFPAATLQAAALIARLGWGDADARAVHLPALAGFATDTGWGQYQGLDREYFHFFKHLLLNEAGTTMAELVAMMQSFSLPPRLRALLGALAAEESAPPPVPVELAERLAEQERAGVGLRSTIFAAPEGEPGFGLISASARHLATLLEVGRLDDPHLIDSDVYGLLKRRANALRDDGLPLTAIVTEAPNGDVRVSLRSVDDGARRLAEALGGGGHDHAAGAAVSGSSLAEVLARIEAWARGEQRIA